MWEGGNFPKTFTFNAADRLVTMMEGANLTTYSYTGYGALETELTGTARTTYTYSGQDQLIEVAPPSGVKSLYTFDGDGMRRSMREGMAKPTTIVWDGSDYLLLNEPLGNRVVLTLEGEIVSCGTRDLLTDPLGSLVREISAGASLGTLVEMYPYGTRVSGTGTPTTPFVFVAAYGYYTDTTDRDYVRARELMKSIGRWMQVDPLWPDEMAYGYGADDPISLTDVSGLRPTYISSSEPIPPIGPMACTPQWNEFVFQYCSWCNRREVPFCQIRCNSYAQSYYEACKKRRRRPLPGENWEPRPAPGRGVIAPWVKPPPSPCFTVAPDCGPKPDDCIRAGLPGRSGMPDVPACRRCCDSIPAIPYCQSRRDTCYGLCTGLGMIGWNGFLNQFGGPSGKGVK